MVDKIYGSLICTTYWLAMELLDHLDVEKPNAPPAPNADSCMSIRSSLHGLPRIETSIFFFCNIGFPCGPVHRLPLHQPPSVAHLLLLPRLTPASRISTSILLPTRVSVFPILLKLTLLNSFRIASSVCNRQLSSSPPSPTELGCRRQKPMLRRRSLRCNQLNFALFSTWRH